MLIGKPRSMKQSGFTLVELMIVVAIIGILAGIAYPSFLSYMMRAKRSDAAASILDLQLGQQKVRANCRFFAGALGAADACGVSAAATTVAGGVNSKEGFYTLALSNASGNSYTITATAVGSQVNDTGCTVITLTVNNANPDGL